jgi:hypothetical protein
MAWEWVGDAATGVVAVAGIAATYWSGKRQQDTALKVARLNIDAQLASEREERHQRRIENAYDKLLVRLSEVRQWALSVYPLMTSTPEEFTMPEMPAPGAGAQHEAAVTAIWSPRVQQLVSQFDAHLRDIIRAGWAITEARRTESTGRESGIDSRREHLELQRLKQALYATDAVVRQQIAAELRGEHDGHAELVPEDGL